jgi:2'-5' RNA ligase
MSRLFIAIDVSEDCLNYLKQLKIDIPSRFVDHIHLTLLFLGEVDCVDLVKEKLSKIRFDEFDIELDKLGVFPNETSPRILWVGIKNSESILDLQKNIEQQMSFLGLKKQNFHPHLTLARLNFLDDDQKKVLLNYLELPVKSLNLHVSSFKLYKSTLTPEGPVYELIEAYEAK